MTAIAPNGVAIADYDPTGVGALVFAGISRADYQSDVLIGEEVDAAAVNLRGSCVLEYTTNAGDNLRPFGDTLTGTWKALGNLHLSASTVTEAATLFMRVA